MKTNTLYGINLRELRAYYDEELEESILTDIEPGSDDEYRVLEDLEMAGRKLSAACGRSVRLDIIDNRVRVVRAAHGHAERR